MENAEKESCIASEADDVLEGGQSSQKSPSVDSTQADTELGTSGSSGDFECFRNFSASEVFVQGIAGCISREDTSSIINSQRVMLQRFEKSNALLADCNRQTAQRLASVTASFKQHVAVLHELRAELADLSRRVAKYRSRTARQHPDHYHMTLTASKLKESATTDTLTDTTTDTLTHTTTDTTTDTLTDTLTHTTTDTTTDTTTHTTTDTAAEAAGSSRALADDAAEEAVDGEIADASSSCQTGRQGAVRSRVLSPTNDSVD